MFSCPLKATLAKLTTFISVDNNPLSALGYPKLCAAFFFAFLFFFIFLFDRAVIATRSTKESEGTFVLADIAGITKNESILG
jgi:hypothetical protein